ncbi:MAG: aldehyde dehydrogenase family protein [Candidatus Nanopelagicales bacterium]
MAVETQMFESHAPGSGEVVGRFPVQDADDVRAAVDAGRIAQRWWADLGWDGRKQRIMTWKAILARRSQELAELVHRENGKPVDDALLEIILSVEHLDWAAKNAQKVLGRRGMRPGLLTANQQASLAYEPLGVVGVIGPWNYPVFTPVGSIGYALAAGNAVVFKPSEWTPAVGAWLVSTFAEAVPEQPVFQQVTGYGDTGAALCRSGVDKISFTGSTRTGRKIMAACAESLTPVLLELGGKDAVLVDEDADVRKAADAVAFGAFSNGGQTCVGVERVYVHENVFDEFLAALADKARSLRPGGEPRASYGPMTMPAQVDIIRRHVADALEKGATPVVGGPHSVGARVIEPIVLANAPEDSAAVLEETFGPTVVVNRVRDLDEAVDRANATPYGLAASLFGRSRTRLEDAASRLRVGMVSINSWVLYAGVPSLPWGGVGESGFGRIHGADGLREFARSKAVVRERFALPISLTSFERHPATGAAIQKVVALLHGGLPWRSPGQR